MQQKLQLLLQQSLAKLVADGVLECVPDNIRIDHSKDKTQGDFASNIAMVLAKKAQLSAKELASKIVANLADADELEKTEIAAAGFINFFMSKSVSAAIIKQIIAEGKAYGLSDFGNKKRVLLEFVSANPTGPLHVGHGRGAAYGATLANLLSAVGFVVDNEYYVNDGGRQMDILALSVYLRYIKSDKFPDGGYQGDYILAIAKKITGIKKCDIFTQVSADEKDGGNQDKHLDDLIKNCKQNLNKDYKTLLDLSINAILTSIKADLSAFGIKYQQWFFETDLRKNDLVKIAIDKLQKNNYLYKKNGALWFKSTDFGDEKDRVVIKDDASLTYFATDIAYHLQKFERGYDKIINIWGADHHGYIARIKAAISALGYENDKLEILLVQFANLFRHGAKVKMSTRSGSFVTLAELQEEIGVDAARFFYILRKVEQHMDFDLDLAKSKTNKNPVFYIQYAHARICSVLAKTKKINHAKADLTLLDDAIESRIIKQLNRYPSVLQASALNYEPHVLAYYLRDLAADLHLYYNKCEFLSADLPLKTARLSLILALKQVLQNGMNLLGVQAPEKM